MRLDCWREATVSRRTTIDSHAIHATGTANINIIQIIFGFQYGNADSNFIESRVLLWSHQSSLPRGPRETPPPAARLLSKERYKKHHSQTVKPFRAVIGPQEATALLAGSQE